MPAGAGKTHLLVDVVREINAHPPDAGATTEVGAPPKVLVLTHTNAGVLAIRKRLGPDLDRAAHVCTITSFAFEFARAYPLLGGTTIPEHPDWDQSALYLRAGAAVCSNRHVQQVLRASFSHVLVDEYQDCSRPQHDLVLLLRDAIPATGVLGDPLQAIFGFDRALPLVTWPEVEGSFPAYPVAHRPWRWDGHNPALGQWLLGLRPALTPGNSIDLSDVATPPGVRFLRWRPGNPALRGELYQRRPPTESLLVITGKAAAQTRAVAGQLGSLGFAAMEDVNGSFMRERLTELATTPPALWARWLAQLAKDCFTGFGDLNKPVLRRLEIAKPTVGLARPGLGQTLVALDGVAAATTLTEVANAMHNIARGREAFLHSGEAWRAIAGAISATASASPAPTSPAALGEELLATLGLLRDRLRHLGRGEHRRQVSRTVLVKGLEYDHVIIANVADLTDACNLYVALTRGRKTVTIIGSSPQVAVTATRGVHF